MNLACRFAFPVVVFCVLAGCGQNGSNPASTAGTSGPPAEAGRHQGQGFSIQVPSGWKVFEVSGTVIYPDGGSGDASIGILLEKYSPGETPEQYLAGKKESETKVRGGVENSDVVVAGNPAFRRVSVFDPDAGSAPDRINYWIAAPNVVCKIDGTVHKAENYSKYLPIYEAMVQSIRID